MPKRTNEFQKLVACIYARLVPEGGRISESVMIKERGRGTEREVDLLLTHRAFGTELRIALECRDRRRRDDVAWIDALIGKYKDLEVDKVIAVSGSGFSRAAREKAAAHRIDALTLREALETDWPAEFTRLRVGRWAGSFRPRSFAVFTRETLSFALTPETVIHTEAGEVFGTVGVIAHTMYEGQRDAINRSLGERFREFFKTRADFDTPVVAEISIAPPSPLYVHDPDGPRRRAEYLVLKMQCSITTEEVETEHYLLGGVWVTRARIPHLDGTSAFSLLAVQSAEMPDAPAVHVEPTEPLASVDGRPEAPTVRATRPGPR